MLDSASSMTIYTLGKRVARRVALHRHGMEPQPFCHADSTTATDPLQSELENSLCQGHTSGPRSAPSPQPWPPRRVRPGGVVTPRAPPSRNFPLCGFGVMAPHGQHSQTALRKAVLVRRLTSRLHKMPLYAGKRPHGTSWYLTTVGPKIAKIPSCR